MLGLEGWEGLVTLNGEVSMVDEKDLLSSSIYHLCELKGNMMLE